MDTQNRGRRLAVITGLTAMVLAGCAPEVRRGWLPGYEDGWVTNQTQRITDLWVGSWVAALIVGAITWGLIIWAVVVYRKRKEDDTLPVQLRYHVPLEVMYIVLPIFMIGVLFWFTARDMTAIEDTSETPDLVVQVMGKQWAWDFNYVTDDVHSTSVHLEDVAGTDPADLPTLYLPVDERVEIRLESRDVIHSFWVPAFLYKKDMIPGHPNKFQIVPTREGVYAGKCAELCGEHHAGMLFNVAIVSREEYDAQMQALRDAGNTGLLGPELNRVPGWSPADLAAEGGN